MVHLTQEVYDAVTELIAQGRSNSFIAHETGIFRLKIGIIRARNPELRANRLKEEIIALVSVLERKKCEYVRATTSEGCERISLELDVIQRDLTRLRKKLHHGNDQERVPAGASPPQS